MNPKTVEEVREEFDRKGDSISHWAVENGFSPSLVYRVLRGTDIPKRGKSHDIAVKLGLKQGEVSTKRAIKRRSAKEEKSPKQAGPDLGSPWTMPCVEPLVSSLIDQ